MSQLSDSMKRMGHSIPGSHLAWLALALMLGALPWACGPLETTGSPGENSLPELFIVNVPSDGSEFQTSPTIFWYGSDRDGQVVRYDYAVVTAAEVDSVAATLPGTSPLVERYIAFVLNDQFPRWTSVFVDSLGSGELPTQDTIRLYASPFPAECDSVYTPIYDPQGTKIDSIATPIDCVSDTIPQYFFVRAIDDHGAVSKIKYRTYKRRNHWPATRIPPGFNYQTFVSLPRVTATYNGILLNWTGSDPLDFLPPSTPFLEFHWRLYGPYPIDPADPTLRPTLDDTLGLQPVFESANTNPLMGVWVRDTSVILTDLWRQYDSRPDPLNDTTITREAWFMLVVTARDDAFIQDETPDNVTFRAINPKFERKLVLVDDTYYGPEAFANPSERSTRNSGNDQLNQAFYWNLVKQVYPEADTMLDFWWRRSEVLPDKNCGPPRVRCGNYLDLSLLLQHRMCVLYDDDIPSPWSFQKPAIQDVLRRYLDAGGMVWFIGRNSPMFTTAIASTVRGRIFDLCDVNQADLYHDFNRLACVYGDMEGMYYSGWRAGVIPPQEAGEPPRPSTSNDEFIGARLIANGTNLPPVLEVDPVRVDSMFILAQIRRLLPGIDIKGIPDVNWMVLGPSATTLYLFQSWRPGGPVPPANGPSFSHDKPVAMRRVGPDRVTPLYKVAFFTCPLYFIKQEQSEAFFREMVDWFMLPFSQS